MNDISFYTNDIRIYLVDTLSFVYDKKSRAKLFGTVNEVLILSFVK